MSDAPKPTVFLPCICPSPGPCPRFGRRMDGRAYQVCRHEYWSGRPYTAWGRIQLLKALAERAGLQIEFPAKPSDWQQPCECEAPTDACPRFKRPMRGRLHQICTGDFPDGCEIPDHERLNYLKHFAREAGIWFEEAPGVMGRREHCVHRGQTIRLEDGRAKRVECLPCQEANPNNRIQLVVFQCRSEDRGNPEATEQDCRTCPHYKAPEGFVPHDNDPPCGVVVGSYNFPGLIELQIKCIRYHCGPVPILISDDCSEGAGCPPAAGSRYDRLRLLEWKYEGVEFQSNTSRCGHAGGDGSAFSRAVRWGKAHGLKIVAKLSQRFVPTTNRWLQDGALELLPTGCCAASQECIEGTAGFPVRSEAVLLDVAQWHRPDVLMQLDPRPYNGVAAESLIALVIDLIGTGMHSWSLLPTPDRCVAVPGFLFHTANPEQEYRELAARHGVDLEDFTCRGWQPIAGVDDAGYQMPGEGYIW